MKKLIILALIYFIFRLFFLIEYPIELDETTSYFWSRENISNLLSLIRADIHPPLTYFIHKIFDLNKTEFGVRWFYFFIFMFSVYFIKKLSDELLNGNEKLYFWIIFLFSSFIIQRTTVARMHAFSFFLSVSLTYFFFVFIKNPTNVGLFWITLLSCFFALNFYPSMVFPFLIYLALMYHYYKKDFFNKILISFILYLVFIFSVVFLFFPKGTGSHFSFVIPTGFIFPYTIFSFAYNEEIINWNSLKTNKYLLFVFFLMLLPIFWSLYKGYKNISFSKEWRLYLFCCFFAFLINFLLSFFIPKLLFSPRYLIYLYPAFLLIFAKGLIYFKDGLKILFLLFYSVYNMFSIYMMLYENKEDWRKVTNIIIKNRKQNEFVVTEYLYPVCFYYNCDNGVFEVSHFSAFEVKTNVWLIYSSISRPKIKHDFFEKFRIERSYRFGNIRVMYFRKND